MENERDYKFKNTVSKDGRYTLHLNADLNRKVSEYCKMNNINKSKYINECISKALEKDESEYLQSLTKEELVSIIMKNKTN